MRRGVEMKNTLYKRFVLHCSLLLCFNTLLVIFNHWGLGRINAEENILINSDNLLVSMVFSAVDLILLFLEFLDVLGIIYFVFFSILVNNKILKNLGVKVILISTITISLLSYLILYIPEFELEHVTFWLTNSLKLAFLFSVLPTVTAVSIKYILLRIKPHDEGK